MRNSAILMSWNRTLQCPSIPTRNTKQRQCCQTRNSEWLHCVSRRCVLFSAPVQTDSTQFTGQVSKLCTNTRFWLIVMMVKQRCWIWFLALGRHTCSLTLSYVSCVFHSPQASQKNPAARTHQVCLHGFINPAAFDWDELEINDQSRSSGKLEKAIQF